jgi:U2 small nuclear ribonucleoprotein B''
MKQSLYHLFSQFGDILEIQARKSFRMKGQAFIVFRDVSSATNAKHALDNTVFFGKQMRVNYSKSMSDVILKHTTKFTHKDKMKVDQERRKRRELEYLEIKKKTKSNTIKTDKISHVQSNVYTKPDNTMPNNTLFVENLPADITESILRAVFSKYNGFKEVRFFAGKGIAFVEYDNEINAGGALIGLNGLNLTADCTLQISFAKK